MPRMSAPSRRRWRLRKLAKRMQRVASVAKSMRGPCGHIGRPTRRVTAFCSKKWERGTASAQWPESRRKTSQSFSAGGTILRTRSVSKTKHPVVPDADSSNCGRKNCPADPRYCEEPVADAYLRRREPLASRHAQACACMTRLISAVADIRPLRAPPQAGSADTRLASRARSRAEPYPQHYPLEIPENLRPRPFEERNILYIILSLMRLTVRQRHQGTSSNVDTRTAVP